jgi:hypothetical protein
VFAEADRGDVERSVSWAGWVGRPVGAPIVAVDPDGGAVRYRVSGGWWARLFAMRGAQLVTTVSQMVYRPGGLVLVWVTATDDEGDSRQVRVKIRFT